MTDRDSDIVDILKIANERGFSIVGLMDNYTDYDFSEDTLKHTAITYKFGLPVCNAVVPVKLFFELLDK